MNGRMHTIAGQSTACGRALNTRASIATVCSRCRVPVNGLLGLEGGATDDLGHDALSNWRHLDLRLRAPRRKTPPRDSRLFPCFYCGCTEYLCLDCRQADGPMWVFDPGNPRQVFAPRDVTFPDLMAGWARGA